MDEIQSEVSSSDQDRNQIENVIFFKLYLTYIIYN